MTHDDDRRGQLALPMDRQGESPEQPVYRDGESTEQPSSAGGTSPTTSEMQRRETNDTVSGFAFATGWAALTRPDDSPVLRALAQATLLRER